MTAAINFVRGTNSGLKCTSGLPPSTNMSVCFWFRQAVTGDDFNALFFVNTASGAGFQHEIEIDWTNSGLLQYSTNSGGNLTAENIVLGQWYFCALTFGGTGSTSLATLYWKKVGEPTCSSATKTPTFLSEAPTSMGIGAEIATQYGFDGDIAGLKIWAGVSLSAEEIERESEQIDPARLADLWAFWPLDHVSDTENLYSQLGNSTVPTLAVQGPPTNSRFYFPATTASDVNPAFDGSWSGTTGAVRRKLSNAKGNSTVATGSTISAANGNQGVTMLDRQYVSCELAAQTLGTGITFKSQLMVREFATNDNVDTGVCVIKVWNNDGTSLNASFFALSAYGTVDNEWINNATCRNAKFATTAGSTGHATAVTVNDGDHMTIELGGECHLGTGTTPQMASRWGETGTDLPEDDTTTTSGPGWIEFSSAIKIRSAKVVGGPPVPEHRNILPWRRRHIFLQSQGTAYTASISESITAPTDAVTRVGQFRRTISESIAIPTDVVTRVFIGSRSITESIVIPTDAVTRVYGAVRGPAESVGAPADSVTRAFVGARPVSESIAIPTDAVARVYVGARSVGENVAIPTDAVTRALVAVRAIAESIAAPTDAASRVFVGSRPISESISAPTDAPTRAFVGFRSIGESINAPTDAVTRIPSVLRSIAENVAAPTDTVARQFVGARSLSESVVAPTDAVARLFTGFRSIGESIDAPTDVVVRVLIASRNIAESIAAPTDAVLRVFTANRNVPENISAPSDDVTRLFTGQRSITESVAVPTDDVTRALVANRSVSENIAAPSDLYARAFAGARSVAENVAIPTDAASYIKSGGSHDVSENVGAPTDAVTRVLAAAREATESVAAPTDAVARAAQFNRGVPEDAGTLADAVTRTAQFNRSVAENADAPVDAVARVLATFRDVTENIASPTDLVNRGAQFNRALTEQLPGPGSAPKKVLIAIFDD